MTTEDYNTEELADEIIGQHLKCSKGVWTLDDEKIATGPDGFRFTALAPSATWGRIKWEGSFPVDKEPHKYSDGFPIYEELTGGWSHYTMCYGLAADGQLLTFTGAYGPRKTIKNLITQYLARGKRLLPVCTLATKPRNDQYGNIDPVLNIVDWVNINAFADMFPGLVDPPQLAAPTAALRIAPKAETPTVGSIDVRSGVGAWNEAPPPAEDPLANADLSYL